MKDLEINLENRPGTLALLGETLGQHNISLEGGGVFNNGENSIAHFLVNDAETAKDILMNTGFTVVTGLSNTTAATSMHSAHRIIPN